MVNVLSVQQKKLLSNYVAREVGVTVQMSDTEVMDWDDLFIRSCEFLEEKGFGADTLAALSKSQIAGCCFVVEALDMPVGDHARGMVTDRAVALLKAKSRAEVVEEAAESVIDENADTLQTLVDADADTAIDQPAPTEGDLEQEES